MLISSIPSSGRAWRVCVVALAKPGHSMQFFEGECRGEIVPEWRGEAGFGYDPVFVPDGCGGRTLAELETAEKHALSHRALAFRALTALLEDRLGRTG